MPRTGTSRYRVLGIDPGLNITGYAAVDFGAAEPVIVEAGTIKTNSRDETPKRISQIYEDIRETLTELEPDLAAVEQLYAHYKHPRTAILMSHARGIVLLACEQAGGDSESLGDQGQEVPYGERARLQAAGPAGHPGALQAQRASAASRCRRRPRHRSLRRKKNQIVHGLHRLH
jgi:hypothetical protein